VVIARYQKGISEPLLNRIEIHVVNRLSTSDKPRYFGCNISTLSSMTRAK
jgi:hypothetical protein